MNEFQSAPKSKIAWGFAILLAGLMLALVFTAMEQPATEAVVVIDVEIEKSEASVDAGNSTSDGVVENSVSAKDSPGDPRWPNASAIENASTTDGAALSKNELSAEVVLNQEKQKHIWEVEHKTFELETYLGKAFRSALKNRDESAIADFFTDDASVSILLPGNEIRDTVATVVETRSDSDLQKSNAQGLAARIVDSIDSMAKIDGSRFRILELNTTNGKDWTSRILLECSGADRDGKRQIVESFHSVKLCFQDDAEIKHGKIITSWTDESRSSRRGKQALMEEATKATGLAQLGIADNWNMDPELTNQYSFQVAVTDFNKDGFPDIAVATYTGTPLLLQSVAGESFQDVAEQMWLKSWEFEYQEGLITSLVAWIDYNNDGWPDLLLGNRLYKNQNGTSFQDVTKLSGLKIGHDPMGACVADYDCDGLPDLYVLYQDKKRIRRSRKPKPWVGDAKTGAENHLWHNEGGHFRDVTIESRSGAGARHSFAAVWHYMDDDHFPDLYVANDFGQNVHLRNLGNGKFEEVSKVVGTSDFATSMGACSGDLNNDGRPELYVANMYSKMGRRIIKNVGDEDYPSGIYEQIKGSCAGNRLYTAQGDSSSFREISEVAGVNDVGWAYAPTMADFDSNGFLDIYATTGFMSFKRGKPDG
ncbi:FG-GAP repeat domain-containing protein [Planctomycetes bacterium K23_9]|uniref:FG-GAP repeat protein n=1 Tax=Stieleria marina TaxID=1930275 RepID=A0A517NT40_9BACT|nr:FG-GAP repeat protein [Planctomycetes bacterium K23_9]